MIAENSTTPDASAQVEIDLFSGRPNPSFELDPQVTSELLKLLGNATPGDNSAARRDGLGFRGFVVTVGRRPQLRVSGPAISVGSEQFLDQARTIERFLLSKMPADLRRQFSTALPP